MKKVARKSMSVILSLLLAFPLASLPVYAVATVVADVLASESIVDDEMGEIIRVVREEQGEYGAISYRYVDESGNEFFPEQSLSTQAVEYDLPAQYNAVDEGYVTIPKNQGNALNCWAFSAMSMLESDSIKKGYHTLETADFSEAHLVWFTGRSRTENTEDSCYGDGYFMDEPFKMGGNANMVSATLARWSGIAEESKYPFLPYNLSEMGNYSEEDRYNKDAGVLIDSYEEFDSADEVKQWVLDHGSASFSLYYIDAYMKSSTYAYCSGVDNPVNHMVTIVGWDDNYSTGNFLPAYAPQSNGAWLCKNSWGPYWGDGGYFWVSYNDPSIEMFCGFSVQKDHYYNNYNYNGAEHDYCYARTDEARMGNVFTARGYEKITAVSFDNAYPDVSAKVYVYKNLPENYTKPIQGTQAAYKEFTVDNPGYYTIPLDEAVRVEPGEIFSVVVMVYNDGDTFLVPAEMKGNEDGCTYGARDGESFFCTNVKYNIWKNSSYYDSFNYYIRALTECDHQYTTETVESTCTVEGNEKIICSQCGKFEGEKKLPLLNHSFSGWITHPYDEETGRKISEKTCFDCGFSEQRLITPIRFVTLDDLLEFFYERFVEAIRRIFMV